MNQIRYSFVGLAALCLLWSCSREDRYLYLPIEKPRAPRIGCVCPDGYESAPDQLGCTKTLVTEPIRNPNATPILLGDDNGSYASRPACLANTNGNPNWPFNELVDHTYGSSLRDNLGGIVPDRHFTSAYWRQRVIGQNRVGIKGTKSGVWYTKNFCFETNDLKQYVIHLGSDNTWKVNIDGQPYAHCDDDYCHLSSVFMSQNFNAGTHSVELKYTDEGGYASVWFEVFDNSFDEIENATQDSQLRAVFSSKSLVGQRWDYEGEVCPAGYTYDVCDPNPKCKKVERATCQ